MQVSAFYPAPDPNDGTNKEQWDPTVPLKRGEYDLVNISLIGFDPNTKWTYEQCHAAWLKAFEQLEADVKTLRWWQFKKKIAMNKRATILAQRQGMGVLG